MNFKLNQDTITEGLITAASIALGITVSNAGMALVPQDQKQIGQGVMAAGGSVLAGGLSKDKSMLGKVAKGAALGIASKQAYDLITGFAKDKVTVNTENASVMDKLTAGALGLACPCDMPMGRALNAEQVFNFSELPENITRVIDDEAQRERVSVSAIDAMA